MTPPLGGDAGFPVLHVITDDAVIARTGFIDDARALFDRCGPALALHLRGPRSDGATLERLARAVESSAGRLVVNDRLDVALAVGADGVQLGRRSMSVDFAREVAGDLPRGRSVPSPGDLGTESAPDWFLLGTIWATDSHPGRPGAGTGLVRAVAAAVPTPVVVIGGVTPSRVAEARAAGAAGVATLGGVWSARDPAAAAVEYLSAWSEA
jgi:thiamine-phosphate diphosphorylase